MGGANQSTVPPPPKTAKVPSSVRGSGSVRFHEEQNLGEVHFHDDVAKLKCAISSPTFFDKYAAWRDSGSLESLNFVGSDGKGGHSSAHFHAFPDDAGQIQVAISVKKVEMGQTVLDLDKLAGY